MSGPNEEHRKEMYRVISWVLRTQNVGLKINPLWDKDTHGRITWELRGICDATWGSDTNDGRSIVGYILYFMDVPISWKSKTMSRVNLSSAEAEYVGMSKLVKEIHFVLKILEFLHIGVVLPVEVFIDNIGEIFMARNNSGSKNTRHVNMRYFYCQEVHGKMIRLTFVRSEMNEAGILTKNATNTEHQ